MADTKTVELEGKQYQVPSDASMDEIDAYVQSKGGNSTAPADLTKTAKYEPEFLPTLSREFFGGASDVATGVGNALSPPSDKFPPPAGEGLDRNILGAAQTGLGILRMLSSPITAGGSQLGESTGELTRQVAEEAGLGPTGQAIAGTAVGAPINVAFQLIGAPAVISAAIPKAMQAVQGGAKMLPGAQVALRKIGQAAVSRLPSILKPAKSADQLFAELRTLENPSIALPEFQAAAKRILKGEKILGEFGFENAQLAGTAGKITKRLTPDPLLPSEIAARTKDVKQPIEKIVMGKLAGIRGGTKPTIDDTELRSIAMALGPPTKPVPFDVLETIRKRIGGRINDFRLSDAPGSAEQLGAYKQLFRDLSKDMDQAAEKFTKLKEANKAANREFAIGELDDIFNASMGRVLEGRPQEITSSNFAKALNKIRDLRRSDELFRKGLGDVNLDSIERRLSELAQLKIMPPPSGANVGSALVHARGGLMGSVGALIGGLVAGPVGLGTGAAAGGVLGYGGPMLISRIMQSPKASRALIDLLRKKVEVNPQNFAALIALAKTEQLDDESGFRSIMKSFESDIKTKIAAANERYNLQRERLTAETILKRQ